MTGTSSTSKAVSDCIVERRANITVTEAEKKLKKLMKDAAFCSNLSTEVASQLSTIRKAFKDLEKHPSSAQ